MSKTSGTYRGVKAVKRVSKAFALDRILIDIQNYHNKTYHFAITPEQLKQLTKEK